MENIEIASIPAIVSIVYTAMQILKTASANERLNHFIPLFSVLLGAVLGGIAFYICPDIIMTNDVITSVIIGAASGWAATGAHQTGKQFLEYYTK